MQPLIFIVHILTALALVALILLQHGKGADMGAAFGSGASQTVFGSRGSTSFLLKITAALAALFFATSLGLGYLTAKDSREVNALPIPTASVPINLDTNNNVGGLPVNVVAPAGAAPAVVAPAVIKLKK